MKIFYRLLMPALSVLLMLSLAACGSSDNDLALPDEVKNGNSFTISSGVSWRYSDDAHFDGVFYRNGDIDTYTELSQAEFYEDADRGWVWYFDGVNTYLLGDDYEIRDDGFAYYREDGERYPAGWLPEQSYDPAEDWDEDWADNWDM